MEMTKEQISNARKWIVQHKEHLMDYISEDEFDSYPPSSEDVNDPSLWKPAHWRWFLLTHV